MDKDILKKAAEILVVSGYARESEPFHAIYRVVVADNMRIVSVDPFSDNLVSRQQLDAIFWYLMKGRDMFYLDGLGHLDAREQVIEYVKSELSK